MDREFDLNYEEMSDGEITWRVHHVYNKIPKGYATICVADYCNNFDDAWPIMEKYGMTIDVNGTASIPKTKSETGESISCKCKGHILRASMICFLKMQEK